MKKICVSLALVLILATGSMASDTPLRIGILPVIDTLPLQVAVKDGLFAQNDLEVELIRFTSALERDTAMQTGQLDGYFGDLIATYLLIDNGVPMRIALTTWRTKPGFPMFGIGLSPANKDMKIKDLEGAKLGLSKSTVMEFLADKMEDHLRVKRGHFSQVEIKKMPIRMQMLMTGQIDSALLPEPLLSLTRLKDGGVLATAENLDLPLTVLCLHNDLFQDNGMTYRNFVAAYTEAVKRLQEKPETYRQLMAETCRIPKPLVQEFPVYPFPLPKLPAKADLDVVQEWMIEKGLLKAKVPNETVLSPFKP